MRDDVNNTKGRIQYLDIAKGFGILLVVWAHAGGPFSAQIDQFHMPMFFLISGFYTTRKQPLRNTSGKRQKAFTFHLCFGIY